MSHSITTLPSIAQIRRRRAIRRFLNVWRARIDQWADVYAMLAAVAGLVFLVTITAMIARVSLGYAL